MSMDFYSEYIYPFISGILSWISCIVPFSLEEIVVLAFASGAVCYVILCLFRKIRFVQMLKREILLLAGFLLWFYLGWGFNYMRTPLPERIGVKVPLFEKDTFMEFLDGYTRELQSASEDMLEWYIQNGYVAEHPDRESFLAMPDEHLVKKTESHVKEYFSGLPEKYGLCRPHNWQHPKKPLLNPLYSGVGVLGFMGPFFCESQLNRDLPAVQYPSVMAHEFSHLLGVSSEAEANYWAYQACRNSSDEIIRYSAYLSVFPYVWNSASGLLDEEEFQAWKKTVPALAILQANADSDYWDSKRIKVIDSIQEYFYNLYLKGNGISSGLKNYSEVIGLLIAIP